MRDKLISQFVNLMKAHGWETANSTNVFTDRWCKIHFRAFLKRQLPSKVAEMLLSELE